MEIITVVRSFKMADGIYPKDIPEGQYVVDGDMSNPDNGTVSKECARIALEEGWATSKKKEAGRLFQDAGKAKPPASSPADPAPVKKTRKKSKVKRKS